MNWYYRSNAARRIKLALPYSYNLCPSCSKEIMLDGEYEKGKNPEGKPAVGRCVYCNHPFIAQITKQREEEGGLFYLSNIAAISRHQYTYYRHSGTPIVKVLEDEEGYATSPPGTLPVPSESVKMPLPKGGDKNENKLRNLSSDKLRSEDPAWSTASASAYASRAH